MNKHMKMLTFAIALIAATAQGQFQFCNSSTNLTAGTVGQPYNPSLNPTICADGGTVPYIYSESGNFPPWSNRDDLPAIDGTPTIATSYQFTIIVKDHANQYITNSFHLTINPVDYTITVSASPTAGGTVTGGGTFASGSSHTVTATANSGYTFANWTEGGSVVSTSASYTFTLTGNVTLVASFTANPVDYTITVSASPTAGGTVTGGGTFASGSSHTVTATANSGYTFVNWTEGGSVVSTSASYTFTLTGNVTLVANFTANPVDYTITVSATPTAGGTVTGGGTFASGSSHTVTATANSGYTFANWTEGGSVVSTFGQLHFYPHWQRDIGRQFHGKSG